MEDDAPGRHQEADKRKGLRDGYRIETKPLVEPKRDERQPVS